jgi:ATP-dependent protease HslVU (ClpYQ) peptidase subunit
MTTIAACYSKREIAADSMVSLEAMSYSVTKLRRGAHSIFGAAGEWDQCLKFLQALETNQLEDFETDCQLIELRYDGIWVYESGILPAKLKNDFFAIGTGAAYAIGAMKMGASPAEAVAIACEFDPASQGPIDRMVLGEICQLKFPMNK